VVDVTDPTHPLYGRRFQILSIVPARHGSGHVVVSYRDAMHLCIPLSATNLNPGHLPALRTKFTREALVDFLSLAKECDTSCPNSSDPSGGSSRQP
jgi:hypothetical protein